MWRRRRRRRREWGGIVVLYLLEKLSQAEPNVSYAKKMTRQNVWHHNMWLICLRLSKLLVNAPLNLLVRASYFEAMCYGSVSKRPVFCGWYNSFSSFRMSLECLDLDQIKFKFPILYEFKTTPPFPQYFYTAFWFVNNNLKNLLWFSVF